MATNGKVARAKNGRANGKPTPIERAAERAGIEVASPAGGRTYTLTESQMASLVGDNYMASIDGDEGPINSLALACSAMDAAVRELKVLCCSADDENVSSDDLSMALFRLANRLDEVSNIAWTHEWAKRRARASIEPNGNGASAAVES
jgi:hypothetical protein